MVEWELVRFIALHFIGRFFLVVAFIAFCWAVMSLAMFVFNNLSKQWHSYLNDDERSEDND